MKIYKPNLFAFHDKNICDKYVSEIIVNKVNKNKKINLGLATGSTPEGIYKILVNGFKNNKVDFSKVSTFNLDEYLGLQANYYKKSYHYYMNHLLFDKININKDNTFFPVQWDKKNSPKKTKFYEYDKLIEKKGGIHLQILGVGTNGHIAFNEPGSDINEKTLKVSLTDSTIEDNSRNFKSIDEVPKESVTMGLKSILNAKEIILIAYGPQKLEAVKFILNAKNYDPKFPCTALIFHPNVTIVTDQVDLV